LLGDRHVPIWSRAVPTWSRAVLIWWFHFYEHFKYLKITMTVIKLYHCANLVVLFYYSRYTFSVIYKFSFIDCNSVSVDYHFYKVLCELELAGTGPHRTSSVTACADHRFAIRKPCRPNQNLHDPSRLVK